MAGKSKELRQCVECNADVPEDREECPNCGGEVKEEAEATAPEEE